MRIIHSSTIHIGIIKTINNCHKFSQKNQYTLFWSISMKVQDICQTHKYSYESGIQKIQYLKKPSKFKFLYSRIETIYEVSIRHR